MGNKFTLRKKTKRKLVVALPIFILLTSITVIWIYHPGVLLSVNSSIRELSNTSPLSAAKRIFSEENEANDLQYFRSFDDCNSDNEEDYCWLDIDLKMINLSPIKLQDIQTYVENEDENSLFIGKRGSETIQYVDAFSINEIDGMSLFIYRDGKTDEEILEYLKGVTIKIYYETFLNSECQMTLRLKNYIVE